MYKCKECGSQVLVIPNEQPIKTCSCNSTIIVDMSATTSGHGGIKL